MTNTVFLTFQTLYILDFSSASQSGTERNTGICQSKDVASGVFSLENRDTQVFNCKISKVAFDVMVKPKKTSYDLVYPGSIPEVAVEPAHVALLHKF
jgi:hypothetical protein